MASKEIELLSELDKELWKEKLNSLTLKLGTPKNQKRLGIILTDYEGNTDTRLKITNGKAHLVQKIGDHISSFSNRTEIDLKLDLEAEKILELIRILQNMNRNQSFWMPIQQYNNYLFETSDFELKLYYQFGKSHFYGYELELKNERLDIYKILEELDLIADNIKRDKEYWYRYDERINLNGKEISDEDLLELINIYLGY